MAARLLALGALVLVVTACGAEAVPPEEVAAAGDTTKALGSARRETVARYSLGNGSESQEFRWTATVDYANDRSTYVDDTTGCRTITIADVSYSQVPSSEGLREGKTWVSYRAAPADGESEFEQSQEQTMSDDGSTVSGVIHLFASPDPEPDEYLDYLRESSGEPERVGAEDVRGVPATRYRTTLDRRREMRNELEAAGWKEANIERYLETMVETDEQIDIWVDVDGLVRRVVSTTGVEGGMPVRTVTTTEYFDFGVETAIEAPPADEVIDSDEWQRLTEKHMREQMEEQEHQFEEGIAPLPGAFEPSVAPTCLH